MAPVAIAIAGAHGRMGLAVRGCAEAREGVAITALFDRPDALGDGALDGREAALARAEVIIDFTSASASTQLARDCAAQIGPGGGGPALVIGSTGFMPEQAAALALAAERIAIIRSGNFSLGVNVLLGLVRQAAAALPAQAYDIEITEAHHRRKLDAPSGTALMLGEAAAQGRGRPLDEIAVRARDGITGARDQGAIGFSVIRGGGIVGEHSVLFAAEDEILTLSHSARDRSLFARGAVEAALWVAGRAPGLYDMQDVLGLTRSD